MLLATASGISRYSMVLFSAHALQHVLVGVLAPVLLLYGAPLRLALRAMRGEGRSLLAAAGESRALRLLAHPAVSSPLLPLALYAWYVSPLFAPSLSNHALHSLAMAAFLVIGLAYFHGTTGTLMPFAVLPLHAIAGIALMRNGTVLGGWYEHLGRRWGRRRWTTSASARCSCGRSPPRSPSRSRRRTRPTGAGGGPRPG